MNIRQRPIQQVAPDPGPGVGQQRKGPKGQQPVMPDLVQRQINRRIPAPLIGGDGALCGQAAVVFGQSQLPHLDGKRIKAQPQIQRPRRKHHGLLKQSLGIDHHLAELQLGDESGGQFHPQGPDDRRAIRPCQITVTGGVDAQRRALYRQIGQGDAASRRIIPQRHRRCVKQNGPRFGPGLQRALAEGQLGLHPRNAARVKGGGDAARNRCIDNARPCQRGHLRGDVFGGHPVDLSCHPGGFGAFFRHHRKNGMCGR